jgi:hypothetical protein
MTDVFLPGFYVNSSNEQDLMALLRTPFKGTIIEGF